MRVPHGGFDPCCEFQGVEHEVEQSTTKLLAALRSTAEFSLEVTAHGLPPRLARRAHKYNRGSADSSGVPGFGFGELTSALRIS